MKTIEVGFDLFTNIFDLALKCKVGVKNNSKIFGLVYFLNDFIVYSYFKGAVARSSCN